MVTSNDLTRVHPFKIFYKNNRNVFSTLIMIIAVFVLGEIVLSVFVGSPGGSFLSFSQVLLTIRLSSFIALFGLCQMLVISVGGGGLDLSVGYIATLAAVLGSRIMDGQNSRLIPALLIAVVVGAFFGYLNGVLTAYMGLPPLVVTMAMANIVQGLVNAYVSKNNITGRTAPALEWLVAKFTGIIPNILFLTLVLTIIMHVVLKRTRVGMKMLGVGANEKTAYLSGVDVRRVRSFAYLASGALAGVIGILLVGNAGQAYKDMGSMYVMPSVVAVVVGGISINGGEANYLAVVLGAVVLQSLTNLFVALGWGDAGKWLGYGVILLFMLIAYSRSNRKNK